MERNGIPSDFSIEKLQELSIQAATRGQYAVGVRKFKKFWFSSGYSKDDIWFPSDYRLMEFSRHLAIHDRVNVETIKSYLSHVKHKLILLNHTVLSFQSARLQLLLKGIHNSQLQNHRIRKPISAVMWKKITKNLKVYKHDDLVLFVVGTLCLTRLLRCGEICQGGSNTHLKKKVSRRDITWGTDHCQINIGPTKTIPEDTIISINRNDDSENGLFHLLLRLYHSSPKKNRDAPLIQRSNGSAVTTRWILNSLRSQIKIMKMKDLEYGTHSWRIGGATELYLLGESKLNIQRAGRWSSDTVEKYIRTSPQVISHITEKLESRLNGLN